jgi:hypothetical protein
MSQERKFYLVYALTAIVGLGLLWFEIKYF